MPGLSHSEMLLANAAKDLRRSWERTASAWRDHARAELQKAYIDPLVPAAKTALTAMDEITMLLRQAITECS